MIVLDTPIGRVVHSADFKMDPLGWGEPGTDSRRLEAIGDEGVLALLSDSTNAELPGRTGAERTLLPALETLIRGCEGRVIVTMFSSNIERVANLVELAGRFGRKVAVVGSSVRGQVAAAERLGLLRFPPRSVVSPAEAMNLPKDESLLVTTGSQGEPLSALSRIAGGRHRDVEVSSGDLVIHSARVIPGSERRIGRMIDRLLELGAQVVTASHARVHVSGHAAREELRELTARLRPRYLIPIHGEYRQLHAHAALAVDAGLDARRVLVARSGDLVVVNDQELRVAGSVPTGRVMVDPQSRAIDPSVLDDRRRAAGAGVVVPVISLADEREATIPDILAPGFSPLNGSLLREARRRLTTLLASGTSTERADPEWIRSRVQADLRSFLRRRTRREPLIVPLVVGPGG
jgi:ribonuclease J